MINNDLKYGNTDPEYIYMDLVANNYNNDDTGSSTDLVFNCNMTQPLLNDASQYNLIVERFKVDTYSSIPSIIPQILPAPNTDVNKTVYSITMNFVKNNASTSHVQQYLQFVPQNKSLKAPTSNVPTQLANEYYYVFGNDYFVQLINSTLTACYNALKSQVEAESDTLPSENAPFLIYDPTDSSIVLNADSAGYDINSSNRIEVYLNNAMFGLLNSFNFSKFDLDDGMIYRLNLTSYNGTNLMIISDTYSVITMYQEFPSVSCWNPCSRIAFISQTLPINSCILTPPTVYNANTTVTTTTQTAINFNVITDLEISYDSSKELYPSAQYIPVTLRKIGMVGRQKLNNFEIKVIWFDKFGNYYPLRMPLDTNATLKICFMRKDLVL
jgi:hypothetical protein